MPAVCRFYLKGYCRYGKNCRFEHPGENRSGGDFSFAKALEEETTNTSSFSFTKALEETTPHHFNQQRQHAFQPQQFYQSTPYQSIFKNNNQTPFFNTSLQQPQQQHQFSVTLNNPTSPTYSNTAYYHHHQQRQKQQIPFGGGHNDIITNFSFAQAAAPANDTLFESFTEAQPEVQLTELELKAYKDDKFQFRLIPVRPPPANLCY